MGIEDCFYDPIKKTLLPVTSYPRSSFRYPAQPQGTLPDPHSSVPIDTTATPSTGSLRRDPVSVERTPRRSSTHTTISPYRHYPPVSDTPPDHPLPKQRGNRAHVKQARVLTEVYARTTVPSIKQQQELVVELNMVYDELQVRYISFFTVSTVRLMSPPGIKMNDS